MKRSLCFLVSVVALALGCHANVPQTGWHVQNDAVCFRDVEGVFAWKHCSDLTGERKTYCQARTLLDRYGHPFEATPVEVFFHASNGVSKVKILAGSHEGEELYCPTELVRK